MGEAALRWAGAVTNPHNSNDETLGGGGGKAAGGGVVGAGVSSPSQLPGSLCRLLGPRESEIPRKGTHVDPDSPRENSVGSKVLPHLGSPAAF